MDALQVRNYTYSSPIQTTVTLYHAVAASPTSGSATSVTCSTSTGLSSYAPTSCSDTTHTVSLAVGDTISLYITTSAGGGFAAESDGGYFIQLHCK